MNEILIHNWNSVVDPQDTVYHLGDFGLGDMTAHGGQIVAGAPTVNIGG